MAETVSAERKSHRNTKVGEVVSTKMAKTIVVEVIMKRSHPLYKRVVSKSGKFYAHDEDGAAHVGDVVRIEETRPLSKLKRWRLREVVRQAVRVETPDALKLKDPGIPKTKRAKDAAPVAAAKPEGGDKDGDRDAAAASAGERKAS